MNFYTWLIYHPQKLQKLNIVIFLVLGMFLQLLGKVKITGGNQKTSAR